MDLGKLSFVSVVKKSSRTKPAVKGGRVCSGILLKETGSTAYHFSGKKDYVLTVGNILYIPEKAKYDIEVLSAADSRFTSLNFEGLALGKEPKIYADFDREFVSRKLQELYCLQTADNTLSNQLKCQALMYEILSAVTEGTAQQKERFLMNKIKPSLDYLHEHLLDTELELDNVGRISRISNASFRIYFKQVTGKSPHKYVTDKRMEYAKTAIYNGSFERIYDIAYACGYNDALYFGKVFKAYYGLSPKQYAEQVKREFID